MASTIKVDNVQNQPGTNIINKCSTTITIGASSDTVALACGASATGFGGTGVVSWDTASIKTAGFVAVTGTGYFCNTTGGIFTVTLPASPSAGDVVGVADYAKTFQTNNLTLGRNSSNIAGTAADATLSVQGVAVTLVYVDGTKGWIVTDSGNQSDAPIPSYVTATGGTPCSGAIVCTNYKVHTFTGPGTFCVSCAGNAPGSNTVDYMIVAGGAGGGSSPGYGTTGAGGGGAGGYRESNGTASGCYTVSPLATTPTTVPAITVTAQPYSIVVGGGGTAGPSCGRGGNGNDSSFACVTSTAGGGGGGAGAPNGPGNPGGSGGGTSCVSCVGVGNTPPTTPPQGTSGGAEGPPSFGTAGGGATVAGGGTPKVGGTGATSSINATPTQRAGGGGGGGGGPGAPSTAGGPATGGGGAGGPHPGSGTAATCNTGGGGGGSSAGPAGVIGGTGGSGVVIIRYKFQ